MAFGINNKTSKEKNFLLFFSLIIISLIVMGLDKLHCLNWLKRSEEAITNPIKQKVYRFKLKINKSQNEKISLIKLEDKLTILEQENASLKVKIDNLEKENSSMRKLLGAPLPPNWKFIPAQVLNINNGSMTINQGSDNGIKENQIAVFKNILVGRVIEVNPLVSKIALPIAKKSNIKAKLLKNEGKGIIKSSEAQALILDNVLPEINLSKDEIVITSGEEAIYPAGLIIGKINKVKKDEAEIYQQAIIKPLVDYQKLTNVFIIK